MNHRHNDLLQTDAVSLAKKEFFSLCHDVKSPLAGIVNIADVLTKRLTDSNQHLANTLLNASQQLLGFIDHFLDALSHEHQSAALQTEHFQLRTVMNEIAELFQPALQANQLSLHLDYDEQLPQHLIGSRVGVYRILLNLLANAIKFTQAGSIKIHAKLAKLDNREAIIKLVVTDTGRGFTPEGQQAITALFSQMTPHFDHLFNNKGQGLLIIDKFVKSMQGEAYLQSTLNEGSVFTIILPFKIPLLSEDAYRQSSRSTAKPYKPTQQEIQRSELTITAPIKILLVEDNLMAQRMGYSLLASLNCEVDVVDTGEKAIDVFEPGKYHLVLMDIGLPGMQGDTTTALIRKMEQKSDQRVPIIALTAHSTEDSKNNWLSAGMEDVYCKPLSHELACSLINLYCAAENNA